MAAPAGGDRRAVIVEDLEVGLVVPDVHAAELARAGRRQASRFAEDARSYLPEIPTSGISRAVRRLFG